MGNDTWGKDPSVQAMRRVFRAMEEAQRAFFEFLGISPRDPRLRSWRERARVAFDSAWSRAVRSGLTVRETEAASLYTNCLAKILEADGVALPQELRRKDRTFRKLFREEPR